MNNNNMVRKLILSVLFIGGILCSCSDFLDRETDSYVDKNMTFSSYEKTNRYLVSIYELLPDGLNRMDNGAMYDAATDDGEHVLESSDIQKFNNGSWNAISNPDNLWDRYYAGIRMTCEFIENADNVDLDKYKLDPNNQPEYQNRLKDLQIWKAEAQFLRAYFHFELLKRFGPIPIFTSSLSFEQDYSSIRRPSMDQCVDFIMTECDKAANDLELTPWRDESALGRATKGAALALKSRLLLYAASPLYLNWEDTSESNIPSDPEKWKKAADAAKDVINLGQYTLHPNYADLFKNAFKSNEYILMRRYGASSFLESYNVPISYGGKGGMSPSQNLVDAYEMKDGTVFKWSNPDEALHPYLNRDERLNATIIQNDSLWQTKKVETWIGGKDGPYNTNATKTGYYLKKFANEEVNLLTGGAAIGHTWPMFRLAEIYLNYAEALNEYDPTHPDIATYVNAVRARAHQPGLPSGLDQNEMRNLIRNERRVELAFEEHRAWDVRRWKIASSTLGADLMGVRIEKKAESSNNTVNTPTTPTNNIPNDEIPAGWYYYDGDEFNGLQIDNKYWGIYGDEFTHNSKYGQPQGMTQTYRKQQVSIIADGDQRVARIVATRDGNPPTPSSETGAAHAAWWSGALSSRDAINYGNPGKYYPLFSRIEIRAKIPYKYGVWMSLWLRHYLGASVAELDLEEVFYKYYQTTAHHQQISQSIHMHNSETNSLRTNANGNDRFVIIDFNPEDDYHVYGVEVDPDPDDPTRHAVIRFLLDGRVTNTWKTKDHGDKYNSFITRAIGERREKSTWDVAITGQIGGTNDGVGYPEDHDPDLRNVTMDIDWIRVFTRENKPFQPGQSTISIDEKYNYTPFVVEKRVFIPKMYWYPIPENELLRMNSWKQNPGW